jgi:hypothetical protein
VMESLWRRVNYRGEAVWSYTTCAGAAVVCLCLRRTGATEVLASLVIEWMNSTRRSD